MTTRPSSTSTTRGAARRLAVGGLVLAALLGAPACGDDDTSSGDSADTTTTTAAAAAEITVADAWARTSPMQATNGAAYLTITGGDADDALVGASVDPAVAGKVEIHETVMADDGAMADAGDMSSTTLAPAMEMRPIESLEIPAGETVSLEPGGYHVMLLELPAPLVVGSSFELTLDFETADDQTVTVEVRDA